MQTRLEAKQKIRFKLKTFQINNTGVGFNTGAGLSTSVHHQKVMSVSHNF